MAIGTYATLTGAKLRLIEAGITDASNDALIDSLCTDVNGWIESKTQRALGPIPTYSSTISAVSAGAQSVTVASATGLSVGDDLLIGLVSGTHEAMSVQGINGTTVTLTSPLANAYAGGTAIQRIWIQDGFEALEDGRLLPVPRGIITLAALEVAPFTGGPFAAVAPGDWYLRPSGPDLAPGWPYTEVWMTNVPSSATTYPVFYPGFGNVRLIGPGPCTGQSSTPAFGWPAVPDEIVDIALKLVVAGIRGRTTAGTDTMTLNIDGSRTFEAALSYQDRQTIERYRLKTAQAV